MKLVIVDNPGAAETLRPMLGADYLIEASHGPIYTLPPDEPGIDIGRDFAERFAVRPDRRLVVAGIKKAAREAEQIYLATAPDREGEAIAWQIRQELPHRDRRKVRRVTFGELTEGAVQEALQNPRPVDLHQVDAWRARQVIDRLVACELEPLLRQWDLQPVRTCNFGMGQTQVAALRLVVEREHARQTHRPESFYTLKALVELDGQPFWAPVDDPSDIADREQAYQLVAMLMDPETGWQVEAANEHVESENPAPPLTTGALLQAAWIKLHFWPGRTMQAARELYEAGLITFFHTGSTQVGETAQQAAREVISAVYGEDFLPAQPPVYRQARDGREICGAIRPTIPARLAEQLDQGLDEDARRLYDLVWQQFIASQMAPARCRVSRLVIRPTWTGSLEDWEEPAVYPHPMTLQATARLPEHPGYGQLSPETERVEDPPVVDGSFAEIEPGTALYCSQLIAKENHTDPPPAFSPASLVQALAEQGLGRPVVYAAVVESLLKRGYVCEQNGQLLPTPLGEDVLYLCISHLPQVFDLSFSAAIERLLDQVSGGQARREEVLSAFYHGQLVPAVQAAAVEAEVWEAPTSTESHKESA